MPTVAICIVLSPLVLVVGIMLAKIWVTITSDRAFAILILGVSTEAMVFFLYLLYLVFST